VRLIPTDSEESTAAVFEGLVGGTSVFVAVSSLWNLCQKGISHLRSGGEHTTALYHTIRCIGGLDS
jgi:hypothetical protein